MTTIGLVRHGITEWNLLGIAQGSSDIPLNETGRQQAVALAERLSSETWDMIVSSDLLRAKETAQIIADRLELPISFTDPRIREINGGQIEGTTEDERIQKWGENWRSLDLGMESVELAAKRSVEFLEDILKNHNGKRVLLVTHGGLIGVTLKSLLPERFKDTHMNNTSITILENLESQWDCTLYNCTKHLTTSDMINR
ncbi:histidine phosphatase family protein [Planomicrobium sp. CPCC 101079]|uniref:histidine phosphatase family protein n=1 Tax=Planomicrobium sp. CPCC 101079 TaxID=2599618 RepID=UPI0011B43522|nr:histidine phosphatase family protein [Planomicrobium sp. CPCC 101079]TWT13208.1 histidine phosphatase family protein [Planomicrobium sp. CPCC 101079]